MPKLIDYPRASLANGLQLAEAVDALGGAAKVQTVAEKMGRKISGALSALISATVKYGLVTSKDGRLATTERFREIRLAYTEQERRQTLRTALLSPPIFRSIFERFSGRQLPVEHFDKLLIREFGVTDDIAPRVAGYFMEGARQAGLLTGDNFLEDTSSSALQQPTAEIEAQDELGLPTQGKPRAPLENSVAQEQVSTDWGNTVGYSVTFKGPGLSSTILINEEDDLMIVEAMLKKVSKALKNKAS